MLLCSPVEINDELLQCFQEPANLASPINPPARKHLRGRSVQQVELFGLKNRRKSRKALCLAL